MAQQQWRKIYVRNIFSNFIKLLFQLSLVFTLFMVLGIIASVTIILWYGNSDAYCRDCDTGLGLCGIGFGIGGVVTPLLIYFVRRFIMRLSIANGEEAPSE